MRRAASLLLVVLLASMASAQEFRARVTEVHNGNTVTVREAGRGSMVIRLEGVDAPGRWRPFGGRSRESLRELVKYKLVTVILRDRDRHSRTTATVLVDDLDVAREQLRRGMAWYDEGADLPDYAAAEAEAEREGRGLWSGVSPSRGRSR